MTDRSSPRRSILRLLSWTALAVSTGLIAWFVHRHRDEFLALAHLDLRYVAALVGLQIVYVPINAGRFHLALEKCSSKTLPFFGWVRLFVLGALLNLVVPQSGTVYRAVVLKQRYGIDVTSYITSFLSIAWITSAALLLVGAGIIAVLEPELQLAGLPGFLVLLFCAVATVVVLPLGDLILRQIALPQKHLAWTHAKTSSILNRTVNDIRDLGYVVRVLMWMLAAFVEASVIFWVCFRAMDLPASWAQAMLFYLLLYMSAHVKVTPGNLGIQELAFALLSTDMEGSVAQGVVLSGLYRVTHWSALLALAIPMGGLDAVRVARAQRAAQALPPEVSSE